MFIKFPSINSMSNVKTTMHHQKVNTILTYNAKVKLHGTNAAISICNGKIFAQ
jgi:hypothetical protein